MSNGSPQGRIKLEPFKGTLAQFFLSKSRFPAIFGGIGSGKTTIACLKGIALSLQYPGNIGYVVRETNPQLEANTMKVFLDLVDRYYPQYEKTRNMNDKRLEFVNGSVVWFKHTDDEGLYKGPEVGWFVIDQAEDIHEDIADMLATHRLRLPGYPQQGMFVGNTNKGHNYCYRWFVDGEYFKNHPSYSTVIKDHSKVPEWPDSEYFHVTLLDNIEVLWKYSPDYVKKLMRKPESYKKVWIYGSWDSPGGLCFEWTEDNLIEPMDPERGWNVFLAIDPPDGNGFCGCLACAIDFDGNIYVLKEYYREQRPARDHARAMKRMWKNKQRVAFMDPSAWRRQQNKDETGTERFIRLKDRYVGHGLNNIVEANNNIEAGIDMVNDYLDLSPDSEYPNLYISRECTHLLDQMREWTWDDIDREPIHLCDALRYGVATRPPVPMKARVGYDDDYSRPDDLEDTRSWMCA